MTVTKRDFSFNDSDLGSTCVLSHVKFDSVKFSSFRRLTELDAHLMLPVQMIMKNKFALSRVFRWKFVC